MAWPTDVDLASIGRTLLVNPTTGMPINTALGIPQDPLPAGGAMITAGTIAAATAMAAVLGAASGKTTYISGFQITGLGATAASAVLVTVTGVVTGTMPYYVPAPASLGGLTPLVVMFDPPVPASVASQNVQVNVASMGAGNTFTAVAAQGFRV